MNAETVESYATQGLRLWATGKDGHDSICPCLICSDVRKYLGWPELNFPASVLLNEGKAAS